MTTKRNRSTLVFAAAIALALLARLVVYQVRDSEVAVVLTFGRPTTDERAPGPGLKWPWPIQQVRTFDARLRVLKTPLEEMVTKDGRAVLVGSFALWRVSSARTFLEKEEGKVDACEQKLEGLVRSEELNTLSEYAFGDLVSADPARLKHEEIERRVLERVRTASAGLGIEVTLVGLRRLALPQEATQAVFDRMRKDREARAADIRAQGEADAGRIKAEAEREQDTLLAAAEADARRALGDAEREAEGQYQVLAQDPGLAVFLKKLEALEALLAGRTTLVLDTGQPPFDLLDPSRGGLAPVSSAAQGVAPVPSATPPGGRHGE